MVLLLLRGGAVAVGLGQGAEEEGAVGVAILLRRGATGIRFAAVTAAVRPPPPRRGEGLPFARVPLVEVVVVVVVVVGERTTTSGSSAPPPPLLLVVAPVLGPVVGGAIGFEEEEEEEEVEAAAEGAVGRVLVVVDERSAA